MKKKIKVTAGAHIDDDIIFTGAVSMRNIAGQKCVLSYSGGKDSILALYRAKQTGLIPAGLITTYNTDRGRSWFHGIPDPVLQAVSESLRLPVHLIRTDGPSYRKSFVDALQMKCQQGVEYCVFGDIDIQEHMDWCAGVCREAGMKAVFPLWKESRVDLVHEFIRLGFTSHITVVDTERLNSCHLGKVLSVPEIDAIAAEGADACGENGEYHSFVSNGPLFQEPVPFLFGEMQMHGKYAVLPLQ